MISKHQTMILWYDIIVKVFDCRSFKNSYWSGTAPRPHCRGTAAQTQQAVR